MPVVLKKSSPVNKPAAAPFGGTVAQLKVLQAPHVPDMPAEAISVALPPHTDVQPTTPSLATAKLVDEAGRLDERIKARAEELKALQKEQAALVGKITSQLGDVSTTLSGKEFVLTQGDPKKTRYVAELQAVREALGEAAFMKLVKVNVTDVEKYLPPDTVAKVIDYKTGDRQVSLSRRVD